MKKIINMASIKLFLLALIFSSNLFAMNKQHCTQNNVAMVIQAIINDSHKNVDYMAIKNLFNRKPTIGIVISLVDFCEART